MHKFLAAMGLALAACGGGSSKSSTMPEREAAPASSACATMAAHMKDLIIKMGEQEDPALAARIAPILERVATERCQTDQWDPKVVACVTAADEDGVDTCMEDLTEAQRDAAEAQIEKELQPIMDEEEAKQRSKPSMDYGDDPFDRPKGTGSAPPPSPPPPDDPCGGGP